MPELGLLFACSGCCCGHSDRGGALAPPRILRSTARRLHKASGLAGQVRLAFSECLGPCSEANVMLLYLGGQALWFRRMNAPELLEALLAYIQSVAQGSKPALPAELASRSFSWAGAGRGPAPPIVEREPDSDGAGAR